MAATVRLHEHDDGAHTRYDVGRAALVCNTALTSARLWVADIRMCAGVVCACAIAIIGAGAYIVATLDASVQPLLVPENLFLWAPVLWVVAAQLRWRWLLWAALFSAVPLALLAAVVCVLWALYYSNVYHKATAAWGVVFAAFIVQALAALGASIGCTGLLWCRLAFDAIATHDRALDADIDASLQQGPGAVRLTTGAMALRDTGAPAAGKKRN